MNSVVRGLSSLQIALLAETAKLCTRAVALTAVISLALACGDVAMNVGDAVVRSGPPPTILGITSASGALIVAAQECASLPGLLLVTVLVAIGVGQEYSTGMLDLLRLYEPRRYVLFGRKALTVFLLAAVFTVATAVALLLVGLLAREHYGAQAAAVAPAWSSSWGTAWHSLCIQGLFLLVALAACVAARNPLATVVGVLGLTAVLAPATRTGVAPFLPHYWIAGWMGFTRDNEFRTYLWNGVSSAASPSTCGLALLGLAGAAVVCIRLGLTRSRLSTPSGGE
jgi:hypothetical protein